MISCKKGMPIEKVTQALLEATKVLSPMGIQILSGDHKSVLVDEGKGLRIESMECTLYFDERIETKNKSEKRNCESCKNYADQMVSYNDINEYLCKLGGWYCNTEACEQYEEKNESE